MGEPTIPTSSRPVVLDSGEYWWRFFTSLFSTKRLQYRTQLDRTIFSLYKAQRLVELKKQRGHIIGRLNADFQRTWFGRNATGEAADIEDMTYAKVIRRMVELIYVKHESLSTVIRVAQPYYVG